MNEYVKNSNWQKISKIIDNAKKNKTNIFFLRKNDFIYKKKMNNNNLFAFRKMCIAISLIKNIFVMTHNNEHFEFDRIYEK